MNMFKKVKAATVGEYLKAVPEDRKEDMNKLHEFIMKAALKLKPHFAYNMIGYGSFQYLDAKKKTVPWPVISLASQKNYFSIYVCALKDGKYLAELHKKELGKTDVGKSCIRFKKFSDLNLPVLKRVLAQAQKEPGLYRERMKK